jgi:dihydrofolate synthase/folylpolyglutamate synthase
MVGAKSSTGEMRAASNVDDTSERRVARGERYALLRNMDTLLLGILADKDAAGIIAPLAPLFAHIAVTQSSSPRAIAAEQLAELVERVSGRVPEVFADVASALRALSERGAAVVATGSITIAGEVKRLMSEGQRNADEPKCEPKR